MNVDSGPSEFEWRLVCCCSFSIRAILVLVVLQGYCVSTHGTRARFASTEVDLQQELSICGELLAVRKRACGALGGERSRHAGSGVLR